METKLYNQEGQSIGTIALQEAVFDVPMNRDLLHQVVVSHEANKRRVVAHTKGRGEVRGGGKKPWQQKGTGRARHGSIRSPLWKGGGVTFGPTKEHDFSKKINKKMARKALHIALSAKLRASDLVIIDDVRLAEPKTKVMAKALSGVRTIFGDHKPASLLVIIPSVKSHGELVRASRNLPDAATIEARNMNAWHVLSHKHVVVLKDALGDMVRTKPSTHS